MIKNVPIKCPHMVMNDDGNFDAYNILDTQQYKVLPLLRLSVRSYVRDSNKLIALIAYCCI